MHICGYSHVCISAYQGQYREAHVLKMELWWICCRSWTQNLYFMKEPCFIFYNFIYLNLYYIYIYVCVCVYIGVCDNSAWTVKYGNIISLLTYLGIWPIIVYYGNVCRDITGQLAGVCSCFQPVDICLISAPSQQFWGELNLDILGDFLASASYIERRTLGQLKHTLFTIVF